MPRLVSATGVHFSEGPWGEEVPVRLPWMGASDESDVHFDD